MSNHENRIVIMTVLNNFIKGNNFNSLFDCSVLVNIINFELVNLNNFGNL